jgi:hypothetical protein
MGMGMMSKTFSDADVTRALDALFPGSAWETTDDAPIAPAPRGAQGLANVQPVAMPAKEAGAQRAVWLSVRPSTGKSAETLQGMGLALQYRLDAPQRVRITVDEGGASLHHLAEFRKGSVSGGRSDNETSLRQLEVDATQGACIVAHGPRGTLVLKIDRDRYHTWHRVEETAFAALLAREVPPLEVEAPPPELPALDALLEGLASPPWLRATYELGCNAPTLFSRAVPLGLVARLWSPVDAPSRATLRTWLMSGRGTASRRVGDWLATSGFAARRESLARAATDAAGRLHDRLETLPERAETLEMDELVQVVGLARLERDDLASVHAVLHLLGGREAVARLDDALDIIDESAAIQRSRIDHAASMGSLAGHESRFDAIAEEEPDAWWSAR